MSRTSFTTRSLQPRMQRKQLDALVGVTDDELARRVDRRASLGDREGRPLDAKAVGGVLELAAAGRLARQAVVRAGCEQQLDVHPPCFEDQLASRSGRPCRRGPAASRWSGGRSSPRPRPRRRGTGRPDRSWGVAEARARRSPQLAGDLEDGLALAGGDLQPVDGESHRTGRSAGLGSPPAGRPGFVARSISLRGHAARPGTVGRSDDPAGVASHPASQTSARGCRGRTARNDRPPGRRGGTASRAPWWACRGRRVRAAWRVGLA